MLGIPHLISSPHELKAEHLSPEQTDPIALSRKEQPAAAKTNKSSSMSKR